MRKMFVRQVGFVLALGLCWLSLASSTALAKDEGKSYSDKSSYGKIQQRLYTLDHELSFGWAFLPLDPYYKGYGADLTYTIHLNEIWALELFRIGFAYNVDSSLKTKLVEQIPDVSPDEFPAVVLYENTNLVLKLLYGKQSFFNRAVLHFEIFATAGFSLLVRNPYQVWEMDMDNMLYEIGVNGGFGFRFWLNPDWSIRVDLRDNVLLMAVNKADFKIENSALIGLSISLNL
jgi:outer membrane beta-barrel protein